jgi:hypothetical protein
MFSYITRFKIENLSIFTIKTVIFFFILDKSRENPGHHWDHVSRPVLTVGRFIQSLLSDYRISVFFTGAKFAIFFQIGGFFLGVYLIFAILSFNQNQILADRPFIFSLFSYQRLLVQNTTALESITINVIL